MTKNKRLALHFCAGLLLVPAVTAAASAPASALQDADDAAEELQGILDEYEDALDFYREQARAAASDEERSRIVRPLPTDYVPAVRAVVERYAGTEAAAKGLQWIYTNLQGGADRTWAIEVLTRDHLKSEVIGEICMGMSSDFSPETEALLREVATTNPHHKSQGQAKFTLANQLRAMHEVATDGRYADYYPGVDAQRLKSVRADELEKEYMALLGEVAEKYTDIPYFGKITLASRAEGMLFEQNNLQLGMTAPDIEAEDIDGVTFKLSDYRGKVVVIDFWGDW